MALFDPKSRYVKPRLVPYAARDARGREVLALPVPPVGTEKSIGEHVMKEGQRLDHLANAYLGDPHGYWRICDLNDAMLPDALAEVETVKIPAR